MTFFAELKRRNVLRVAVLYLAACWVLMQVTDVSVALLGLPSWTGRLLLLLLALGLPVALALSWIYEVAPGGLQRDRGDLPDAVRITTARRLDIATIVVVLAGAALLVADRWRHAPAVAQPGSDGVRESDVAAGIPYIAVLPFADLSQAHDQAYFAEGLAEELLGLLSGTDGLKVAARTSAFRYRGNDVDVREVARALGVSHVVQGSVRRSGSRIRVSAQLVDARAGHNLWSQSFDRHLEDVFALQDEIGTAVARALEVTLKHSAAAGYAPNQDAYDLYLRGRYEWRRIEVDRARKAVQLFKEAIAADPAFGLAYGGIADALTVLAALTAERPADLLPQARAAAARAVELSPDAVLAHEAVAAVEVVMGWNWPLFERSMARASELNPDQVDILSTTGNYLTFRGRLQEALTVLRRARELDPYSPVTYWELAEAFHFIGDDAAAMRVYEDSRKITGGAGVPAWLPAAVLVRQGQFEEALVASRLAAEGNSLWARVHYAETLAKTGHREEALRLMRELERGAGYVPRMGLAIGWASLGDIDRAFALLDEAFEAREYPLLYVRVLPVFETLRADPRWAALLRRLDLDGPGYGWPPPIAITD